MANGTSEEALLTRHQAALDRIEKRLGHQRHVEVAEVLTAGFSNGRHEGWIERLLTFYYDPMYDYQPETKQRRVEFRGGRSRVTACLQQSVASAELTGT